MGIKIPLSTGYASAAAIEFGIGFWLFTKPQTEKKRLSLVGLSTILSLRNVVVPTAVESHIANVTYHRSVYWITKTRSTKRRSAQETLRFREGNTEYYFSINVKKFSELSFIVFEACGLRNVLVSTAVESQNTVHKEALCSTDATL